MDSIKDINEAVLNGEVEKIAVLIDKALKIGIEPLQVLSQGLIAGMDLVGKRFKTGEMFLPEVMASGEVVHQGLDILKPIIPKTNDKPRQVIIMGTVEGDIHNIGKKVVCFLLEGNGFEVIDLGVDVKADAFAQAVKEYSPAVMGMSALLTTTIPNMKKTIEYLKESGLRDRVKIIAGGAAVTEEFARAIGADGYAPEASSAVEWVKQTIK
jgi:5-methyltetrahydrofolate--homocysteine methyltransferase